MTTTPNFQAIKTISPATLHHRRSQDNLVLIDVREVAEYAGDRIAEAVSVPLSQFDPQQVPSDRPVVLYCQSSKRSEKAAQRLLDAGWSEVTHLEGGLNAWKADGYATVASRKAPISLFRQVQIVAGSLVFTGTVLSAFVSPWFLILSGFVGAGLVFAGVTDTCAMGMLLAKLPYNQNAGRN